MLGVAVGSYQVTAKISEGGMGAVYRGEHALLGRPVAIKVLLPRLSSNRDLVDRLFLEARTTSQIRHPGIVDVLDFGYTAGGEAYLVMELLDGESLAQRMHQRGRMREAEAAAVLRGVASALAAAHASGVVHRDLKPDNIFLVRDPELGERTKILDFGIAKLGDRGDAFGATDSVIGTPMYMAPEQCRGAADADHRADLYSLGCILYEMLTGRPPFASESTAALIAMHQSVEPESPRRLDPSISTAAEALLARLLAKRPEARLGSAAELVDELGQLAASGSYAALLGPRPRSSSVPMYLAPPATPAALIAPTIPSTPTTLSGAASATVVPVRNRRAPRPRPARRARRVRPLFVAALAVVSIAGGVAGIAMLGGDPAPAVASPSPQAHVQAFGE